SELERVRHRLESKGGGGSLLPMECDQVREIEVAKRIARDHEERVVEAVACQTNRAGRSQRRLLDRVLDVHPKRLDVSERDDDPPGPRGDVGTSITRAM